MVLTQWLLILVVVAGYWFGKNRITAIISQIGREILAESALRVG